MSRYTTNPATLLLIVLAAARPASVAAQATAQVSVSGGIATDQHGVRSNALTVAPSASLIASQQLSLQLGGSATRFTAGAHSLGAGATALAQEQIGRHIALTLGGNAGVAHLSSTSTATFMSADVMPAIELRAGHVALFGGYRAASGRASERAAGAGLPVPGTRTSAARNGVGPAFGGVVTLGNSARTIRLTAREDRLAVEGARRPERSFGASLAVALTSATSLEVAGGRYDANRLLGTPAGEYVGAGLVWRFGGRVDDAPLPRATGAPQPRGTTRFSIRAPEANRVDILGDFNEWTPVATRRAANGVWYADLSLPAGQYRYAFRIDGKEWRVPDGATAVDDGFGGKSAWITVSDSGRDK